MLTLEHLAKTGSQHWQESSYCLYDFTICLEASVSFANVLWTWQLKIIVKLRALQILSCLYALMFKTTTSAEDTEVGFATLLSCIK